MQGWLGGKINACYARSKSMDLNDFLIHSNALTLFGLGWDIFIYFKQGNASWKTFPILHLCPSYVNKALERRRSNAFIVNFKQIPNIFRVFLPGLITPSIRQKYVL